MTAPPLRPPTPRPARSGPGRRYRRCAWRPGHTGLRSPSASAGRRTSSSWRRGSSRSAASTSRTVPGPAPTWARSSCRSARRPPRWASSTRRLTTCGQRPRSATPTAPVATLCKPASNSPPRSPAGRRPATGTRRWPRWPPPRQIGQTLYVSERTAENHVQHILTKLGLRNRSQIAAWASGERGASRL
ncbi:MAG: helix-turn-helix transcriptional regulator [Streptosporangiaceae bacterium]